MPPASSQQPRDLRQWIAAVDELGELKRVDGASWELEIGAIAEINNHQPHPPALLFDRISGYPAGHRLLTSANVTAARLGLTLGLGTELTKKELVKALRGAPSRWATAAKSVKARMVDSGPVSEHESRGDAVSVLDFPAPLWRELDGGRYIGTGCLVVTRDFDSDWINVGTYRAMVHDERSVGVNILSGKHGRIQYEKAFAAGERFPMAIVLGHDPLLALLAGVEMPYGVSEFDVASAIAGPIDLIPAPVTGLPVPASAEIVLDGWCRGDNFKLEGPLGEFTGYYSFDEVPAPVLEVEAVWNRTDPIILGSPPAKPPHDYSYWVSILRSAIVLDALETAGVPDVRGVWEHEAGASRMFLVVSIKQRYAGHARQAMHLASQGQGGAQAGRYVVVVDDDIDPTNLEEVIWAMATRSDPERDIDLQRRAWGSTIDPLYVTLGRVPLNSRALIDACIPYEFIDSFPKVAAVGPELERRVRERWGELFRDDWTR